MNKLKKILKTIVPGSFLRYRDWVHFEHAWQAQFIESEVKEHPDNASFIRDLKLYTVCWNEWKHIYRFEELNEDSKKSFISVFELQRWYRKFNNAQLRNRFYDKAVFAEAYKQHMVRKVIVPCDCLTEEYILSVKDLLANHDVIYKPSKSSLGIGIKKISRGSVDDIAGFCRECLNERILLEECVCAHPEIAKFNPSALSTIRIMTAHNGGKPKVFGAFVRFAVGDAVVDNAHEQGGMLAYIDIDSGRVSTNAKTVDGLEFECHPKTEYRFLDTQIPYWEKAVDLCLKLHSKEPLPFIGWDLCIMADGSVDIIEGNHAADADGMQFFGVGRRSDFMEQFKLFHKYIKEQGIINDYPNAAF